MGRWMGTGVDSQLRGAAAVRCYLLGGRDPQVSSGAHSSSVPCDSVHGFLLGCPSTLWPATSCTPILYLLRPRCPLPAHPSPHRTLAGWTPSPSMPGIDRDPRLAHTSPPAATDQFPGSRPLPWAGFGSWRLTSPSLSTHQEVRQRGHCLCVTLCVGRWALYRHTMPFNRHLLLPTNREEPGAWSSGTGSARRPQGLMRGSCVYRPAPQRRLVAACSQRRTFREPLHPRRGAPEGLASVEVIRPQACDCCRATLKMSTARSAPACCSS